MNETPRVRRSCAPIESSGTSIAPATEGPSSAPAPSRTSIARHAEELGNELGAEPGGEHQRDREDDVFRSSRRRDCDSCARPRHPRRLHRRSCWDTMPACCSSSPAGDVPVRPAAHLGARALPDVIERGSSRWTSCKDLVAPARLPVPLPGLPCPPVLGLLPTAPRHGLASASACAGSPGPRRFMVAARPRACAHPLPGRGEHKVSEERAVAIARPRPISRPRGTTSGSCAGAFRRAAFWAVSFWIKDKTGHATDVTVVVVDAETGQIAEVRSGILARRRLCELRTGVRGQSVIRRHCPSREAFLASRHATWFATPIGESAMVVSM